MRRQLRSRRSRNRERTLDEVLADEQRVYAELLPLLEQLTSEELADPDCFDRMMLGVPPWRISAGSTLLHDEAHRDVVSEWLSASGEAGRA
jgi:hypothetical protein